MILPIALALVTVAVTVVEDAEPPIEILPVALAFTTTTDAVDVPAEAEPEIVIPPFATGFSIVATLAVAEPENEILPTAVAESIPSASKRWAFIMWIAI